MTRVVVSDEIPVIHHEEEGGDGSSGSEEESEEEESFEEGTYEARQGNVSYQCDADAQQQSVAGQSSGMTGAKSQEE